MLNLAEAGTLAKAAEKLHISQPTITRSMQHLERDFGASLFKRERNRIELNETGQLALEYAKKILFDTDKAVNSVRAFDQSLRTITIASCAPAPLWSLLPALSDNYREKNHFFADFAICRYFAYRKKRALRLGRAAFCLAGSVLA